MVIFSTPHHTRSAVACICFNYNLSRLQHCGPSIEYCGLVEFHYKSTSANMILTSKSSTLGIGSTITSPGRAPRYPYTPRLLVDHFPNRLANASGYEEASHGVPREPIGPILYRFPHATMKKQSHLRLCIDSCYRVRPVPPRAASTIRGAPT
jgi:hypothetical protein